MRRALLAVLPLIAACSGDSKSEPDAAVSKSLEFQGWTVTAEKPQLASDGTTITGAVTFARQSGGETRGGGACLVADLHGAHPCATLEDCAVFPVPTGGFHYCVGVNGGATTTCWTRPSAEGCTRAPDRVPGTYATSSTSARVDGKATTWLSLACLAADGLPMGCASPDPGTHIYATSVPLVVPAP